MSRLSTVFALGGVGLLLTPITASAQFVRPFGLPGGFRIVTPVPIMRPVPLVRPVPIVPPVIGFPQFRYSWNTQFDLRTSFGGVHYRYSQFYIGPGRPGQFYWIASPLAQPAGYRLDGVVGQTSYLLTQQENLARAQRLASASANLSPAGRARPPIPVVTVPASGPLPPGAAGEALTPAAAADIASGAALNEVLREIVRVGDKGVKVPSAYLPPHQLADVQFAGPPSADLLNLARRRALEWPPALNAPELAAPRAQLAREFAASVAPLRGGKAPDAVQVGRLETAFQALEQAAAPVLGKRSSPKASEAHQFLERMGRAITAIKGGPPAGLIDPSWDAEGLTGAELVRYMSKYELQFGPAPRGEEETYEAIHQNLATYLYVLSQAKK